MASDIEGSRGSSTRTGSRTRAERVQLDAPLDKFLDGGALWLELETAAAALTVERVRWTVDEPAARRPTAVVICTFNRADDCLATLRDAGRPTATWWPALDAVYVVDQGTDTVDSRTASPRSPARSAASSATSGSPTSAVPAGSPVACSRRCARTADPVEPAAHGRRHPAEPDTVLRMRAFAERAGEPDARRRPDAQAAAPQPAARRRRGGPAVDPAGRRAGRPAPLFDVDVTETTRSVRVDAAYNGWWSCLIPSEVVAAIGYPLPLFFQWDDIEYGLRAGAPGSRR